MKLFGFLDRGHKPDIDALSALVDGALDAGDARELEAHVAGCAACAAELDGLRAVKSMLAALPQVEPTRAFRVRLADVEAQPRPSRAPTGVFRAMPALAAVAAFVFVGVLAADFSTRDSDGDRQASLGSANDSAAVSERATNLADSAAPEDDGAAGATEEYRAAAATPALPGTTAGAIAPDATAEAGFDNADAMAPPDASGTWHVADGDLPANAPDESPAPETSESATASDDDNDSGNRMGFLVVEITAGVLAVGAAAIFFVSRRRSSEG